MEMPHNAFKRGLAEGRLQIGLRTQLADGLPTEIVAPAGFDWLVIDTEHAPNHLLGVLAQLRAMDAGTAEPVERPPSNDVVAIKHLLDAGARTLLVPMVDPAVR